MPRKYTIALATAALAAGGATLVPVSSGQGGGLPNALTLEMRHREAKVAFVDEPPRMKTRRSSESPGDTVISRGRLRASSGAPLGRIHSEFVVTGGRSPRTTEQATGTLVLPDGQIAIQGVFANTGDDKDVIAIVGGTGRYNGATGHAEIASGRRAVTFTLRFAR
jgi:hypothetical protein